MNRLIEMSEAPNTELRLYHYWFGAGWTCTFSGKVNDLKVEIENTAPTPDEAIALTYATFRNLAGAVRPLASPMLEAPQPPVDDDIPF